MDAIVSPRKMSSDSRRLEGGFSTVVTVKLVAIDGFAEDDGVEVELKAPPL
jgi:hypothetical protein